jgi:hypothetical protein
MRDCHVRHVQLDALWSVSSCSARLIHARVDLGPESNTNHEVWLENLAINSLMLCHARNRISDSSIWINYLPRLGEPVRRIPCSSNLGDSICIRIRDQLENHNDLVNPIGLEQIIELAMRNRIVEFVRILTRQVNSVNRLGYRICASGESMDSLCSNGIGHSTRARDGSRSGCHCGGIHA